MFIPFELCQDGQDENWNISLHDKDKKVSETASLVMVMRPVKEQGCHS